MANCRDGSSPGQKLVFNCCWVGAREITPPRHLVKLFNFVLSLRASAAEGRRHHLAFSRQSARRLFAPNKISAMDFDGWVEERGSKWMNTWDERYTPLLECNDRQQPPQRGGLMFARYGKGTFVYAAYAFYRQLPAGVQGGYRLFSNIVSLKKRSR